MYPLVFIGSYILLLFGAALTDADIFALFGWIATCMGGGGLIVTLCTQATKKLSEIFGFLSPFFLMVGAFIFGYKYTLLMEQQRFHMNSSTVISLKIPIILFILSVICCIPGLLNTSIPKPLRILIFISFIAFPFLLQILMSYIGPIGI